VHSRSWLRADFKYATNDSVFLVNHDDYKMCSTATPVSRFTDGDTSSRSTVLDSSTSSAVCPGAARRASG
jgi:hypothetical protein